MRLAGKVIDLMLAWHCTQCALDGRLDPRRVIAVEDIRGCSVLIARGGGWRGRLAFGEPNTKGGRIEWCYEPYASSAMPPDGEPFHLTGRLAVGVGEGLAELRPCRIPVVPAVELNCDVIKLVVIFVEFQIGC